jgi:hypothetical protein
MKLQYRLLEYISRHSSPPDKQLSEDHSRYKVVLSDIPQVEVQVKIRNIDEAEIPAIPEFTLGLIELYMQNFYHHFL